MFTELTIEEINILNSKDFINGDEIIIRSLTDYKGIVAPTYTKDKWLESHPYIKTYLENRFEDKDYSVKETIKRIINHIEEKPKCPYCGKPVEYVGKPSIKFRKYCSKSCANLDPGNQELRKNNSIRKWGYESPSLNPEVKRKISSSIKEKSEEMNKHRVETWIKKYGIDNVMKLKETQNKSDETKRINDSYKRSTEEDVIFDIIKNEWPDAIHSYKSERYPFNCDYYIPSLNLFIEYQGFWTHGDHPYDNNNIKDINEAEYIKAAGYLDKYDTWTRRDPNKREYAKKNNLNYLEIWRNIWSEVSIGNKDIIIDMIKNFVKNKESLNI